MPSIIFRVDWHDGPINDEYVYTTHKASGEYRLMSFNPPNVLKHLEREPLYFLAIAKTKDLDSEIKKVSNTIINFQDAMSIYHLLLEEYGE